MTNPAPEPVPNSVPVPEPSPSPSPAPKPRGLVRWGVLIFLVVSVSAFALFGAGPLTRWAVQKYGSQGLGTEVRLERARFNIFTFNVTLGGLRVLDPKDAAKDQFSCEEIAAHVSASDAFKGRLVLTEARVKRSRGRLVRNADGSINAGPPPEPTAPGEPTAAPPPGTPPDDPAWRKKLEEAARKRDLVEDVKRLLRKVKEVRDERAAERERRRKEFEARGVFEPDARAEYVRGGAPPAIVIRSIVCEDVEVEIEDKAAGAPPQTITEGRLEIKEWSSHPTRHDKPMEVKLSGKLGGAAASAIKLDGLLDLTGEEWAANLHAILANLPLERLDPYYRDAIPIIFDGTSLGSLDLPLNFKNWEIDWKPEILLDKIDAKPRDPGRKIAGFESGRVAQELENAGRLIVKSIRIHGKIWAPQIEGDVEMIKALVLEGGKSYALKQGQKALDKQTEKLLEKNPELKEKVLEKNPELKDAAEKGLGKALDLFGGKKDPDK